MLEKDAFNTCNTYNILKLFGRYWNELMKLSQTFMNAITWEKPYNTYLNATNRSLYILINGLPCYNIQAPILQIPNIFHWLYWALVFLHGFLVVEISCPYF